MRKKKHPEHVNHERWLVSYADFITLLFAFFVVMFAVSQVDTKKMGRFTESFQRAVGASVLLPGGTGLLLDGASAPSQPEPPDKRGDRALPPELEKLARTLADKRDDLAGLKVLRRRNELVIRLADSVLFDSGDDRVKEPAVKVLTALAGELRERSLDIRVEGHTDDVPIRTVRFRSNWDLSTARATAVIELLAGRGRLPPARLSASGYGEFHPVGPNTTVEGRSQNRRVDLVIAVSLEDEPAKGEASAKPDASGKPEASGKPDASGKPEAGPAKGEASGPPEAVPAKGEASGPPEAVPAKGEPSAKASASSTASVKASVSSTPSASAMPTSKASASSAPTSKPVAPPAKPPVH